MSASRARADRITSAAAGRDARRATDISRLATGRVIHPNLILAFVLLSRAMSKHVHARIVGEHAAHTHFIVSVECERTHRRHMHRRHDDAIACVRARSSHASHSTHTVRRRRQRRRRHRCCRARRARRVILLQHLRDIDGGAISISMSTANEARATRTRTHTTHTTHTSAIVAR
jgi:hypothetical protein